MTQSLLYAESENKANGENQGKIKTRKNLGKDHRRRFAPVGLIGNSGVLKLVVPLRAEAWYNPDGYDRQRKHGSSMITFVPTMNFNGQCREAMEIMTETV